MPFSYASTGAGMGRAGSRPCGRPAQLPAVVAPAQVSFHALEEGHSAFYADLGIHQRFVAISGSHDNFCMSVIGNVRD